MPSGTHISKVIILTTCSWLFFANVADATTCIWGKSFKVRQICGTVADPADVPIPQAKIEILTYPTQNKVAETNSDTDGRFSVEKLKAGKYLIRAHSPGFPDASQPFELVRPQENRAACNKPIQIAFGLNCSGVKNAFKDWK